MRRWKFVKFNNVQGETLYYNMGKVGNCCKKKKMQF